MDKGTIEMIENQNLALGLPRDLGIKELENSLKIIKQSFLKGAGYLRLSEEQPA